MERLNLISIQDGGKAKIETSVDFKTDSRSAQSGIVVLDIKNISDEKVKLDILVNNRIGRKVTVNPGVTTRMRLFKAAFRNSRYFGNTSLSVQIWVDGHRYVYEFVNLIMTVARAVSK